MLKNRREAGSVGRLLDHATHACCWISLGALGEKANQAIIGLLFPSDPLSMAQQMSDIVGGANAMAKYVHSAYPTDAERAARDSKKKEGEE